MKKSILVLKNDRSNKEIEESFQRFLNGETKPVNLENLMKNNKKKSV